MSGEVEVRRVVSPEDRARIAAIRREVFVVEQKVPPEEEFDEHDETALHVVALVGDRAVGTGRLIVDGDQARIGRMAVLADQRGRGVGRLILEELLRAARESGVRSITLHAQTHAVGFYESFGFRAYGEVFDEAGIPHRRMRREI